MISFDFLCSIIPKSNSDVILRAAERNLHTNSFSANIFSTISGISKEEVDKNITGIYKFYSGDIQIVFVYGRFDNLKYDKNRDEVTPAIVTYDIDFKPIIYILVDNILDNNDSDCTMFDKVISTLRAVAVKMSNHKKEHEHSILYRGDYVMNNLVILAAICSLDTVLPGWYRLSRDKILKQSSKSSFDSLDRCLDDYESCVANIKSSIYLTDILEEANEFHFEYMKLKIDNMEG